ncbi:hypothetical protein [Paraburkholderia sp. RL17-337-BIB-A]|uniref:hypothetical protein n=1 Tax=Paraburkholderia sp. RL17-337-BIB-A TaxID=3031636 RepID=UPI0038BD6CF4
MDRTDVGFALPGMGSELALTSAVLNPVAQVCDREHGNPARRGQYGAKAFTASLIV